MKLAGYLAAFVLASSFSVHARASETGPHNALSVHPFSLTAHGFALDYERFFAPPRFSLASSVGLRSSSRGDYSSLASSVGIEPRFWLRGPKWSKQLGSQAMTGPYCSLRLDASWLMMSDTRRNEWVGGSEGFSLVGSFGWRFALGHFAITPSIGAGARTDLDASGRLSPWTRATFRFDWTLGWMF